MRKLALILALALFMTLLCSCDIGDVSEIEDIGSIIGIGSLSYTPLKDKFELVDHSQRLPLYYYSYGGDYHFDSFLIFNRQKFCFAGNYKKVPTFSVVSDVPFLSTFETG